MSLCHCPGRAQRHQFSGSQTLRHRRGHQAGFHHAWCHPWGEGVCTCDSPQNPPLGGPNGFSLFLSVSSVGPSSPRESGKLHHHLSFLGSMCLFHSEQDNLEFRKIGENSVPTADYQTKTPSITAGPSLTTGKSTQKACGRIAVLFLGDSAALDPQSLAGGHITAQHNVVCDRPEAASTWPDIERQTTKVRSCLLLGRPACPRAARVTPAGGGKFRAWPPHATRSSTSSEDEQAVDQLQSSHPRTSPAQPILCVRQPGPSQKATFVR